MLRVESRTPWWRPLNELAALVWPGPCLLCGEDLPPRAVAGVCPACWLALAPDRGPTRRGIVAAHVYEGAVVTLHRRLKFAGAVELARPLARRMAAAWRWRGRGGRPLVVPVPPDPLRLPPRRRVARLLARELASLLDLPFAPRALRKPRPTRSQTGQGGAARRRALAGAFVARDEALRGRQVLVVDDVTTTGGTLVAARDAAQRGGAVTVSAVVLARTPPPGGSGNR
jgi:predicted amidophosphoribosyltransferase